MHQLDEVNILFYPSPTDPRTEPDSVSKVLVRKYAFEYEEPRIKDGVLLKKIRHHGKGGSQEDGEVEFSYVQRNVASAQNNENSYQCQPVDWHFPEIHSRSFLRSISSRGGSTTARSRRPTWSGPVTRSPRLRSSFTAALTTGPCCTGLTTPRSSTRTRSRWGRHWPSRPSLLRPLRRLSRLRPHPPR